MAARRLCQPARPGDARLQSLVPRPSQREAVELLEDSPRDVGACEAIVAGAAGFQDFVASLRSQCEGQLLQITPAEIGGGRTRSRDVKERLSGIRGQLAVKVGASRSFLAQRFADFLGQPPLAYLAGWRLQLAARLLQTTQKTIIQVAFDVGYESEAACNRAFKREFGLPPAQYRHKFTGNGAGLPSRSSESGIEADGRALGDRYRAP